MSNSIPISDTALSTDHLILRWWTPPELDAVVGGERLPHWAEDFPADGDRVIAGVVGSTSLLWPPAEGSIELGYGVVESRRGRGYATEAASAMVGLALDSPGIHEVVAEVELANPASARVLEKVGLRRRVETDTTARYSTGLTSAAADVAER